MNPLSVCGGTSHFMMIPPCIYYTPIRQKFNVYFEFSIFYQGLKKHAEHNIGMFPYYYLLTSVMMNLLFGSVGILDNLILKSCAGTRKSILDKNARLVFITSMVTHSPAQR